MATMVAIVNSAAVGVGVACLCLQAGSASAVAAGLGTTAGLVHLVAFLEYQQRRFVALDSTPPPN